MNKKNGKNIIYAVILAMMTYTATLSIGLSIFSENVNVEGTSASICSNIIDPNLTVLVPVGSRYVLGPIPDRFVIVSETLIGNELTLTYQASANGGGATNTTVEFEINNVSLAPMYNGNVSATVSSSNYNLYDVSPSLGKTTVPGNDSVRVYVTFTHRAHQLSSQVSARVTINYFVGGCSQYFYFNIVMLPR